MDLKQVLDELRGEQQSIANAIRALEPLEQSSRSSGKVLRMTGGGGHRTMSPAARRRISESMKKRWAQRKRAAA